MTSASTESCQDLPECSNHSVCETSEEEFINENLRPVTVTVSDDSGFKTVIGDAPMTPGGRYYYEVKLHSGDLIKIGVCRPSVNTELVSDDIIIKRRPLTSYFWQAFSDSEDGWAFYKGELRHGSNNDGEKYGSAIEAGDVVGVLLDTIQVRYAVLFRP